MPDIEISTLSDLVENLANDTNLAAEPTWYRGHADASWKLLPGFYRLASPPSESSLLNRFRQNANFLLQRENPVSSFDWMFLMQHYGVPTRLLDWTESPLVALYFALDPNNPDTASADGALWLLRPHALNNHANLREQNYIPAFEEEDFLGSYSPEKYEIGRDPGILPIAAIATRNNARIQAQMGAFTINHKKAVPIEEVGDKAHIKKYVIPSSAKKSLTKQLELLAVGRFQMFPELSSIGQIIKETLS